MPSKYKSAGLSWKDVEDALEYLQRETQTMAQLEIYPASLGMHQEYGLIVRLRVTRIEAGGSRGCSRTLRLNWPSYGHKTMPGLVLALIHDMHEDIARVPLKPGTQGKIGLYPPG